MKTTCEICNKEFIHWRYDRTPRFCSLDCRIKSKDTIIKCLNCDKEFRVPSAKGTRKFCTQTCSNQYNQRHDPSKISTFVCRWCGKEFGEWTYRRPTICSNQCRSEYGASIRANQLYKGGGVRDRGIGWKKQAGLARKRDNYTCQVCGRNGWKDHFRVNVHHIKPYREFDGDYKKANHLSNLISLCPSCHPKVECGLIPCPNPLT